MNTPMNIPTETVVFMRELIQKQLKHIEYNNPDYYKKLTEEYGLSVDTVTTLAIEYFNLCKNLDKKTKFNTIEEFTNKYFANNISNEKTNETTNKKTETTEQDTNPLENYINYLLAPQSYCIFTAAAAGDLNFAGGIISKLLGIYRHACIDVYDSPFANSKRGVEVLELNPSGQSNVLKAKKAYGQVVTEVPGIVTMALHISGRTLLNSGQYDLINYRPWHNDCHTYIKHAQQRMNQLLPPKMQQNEIKHYRYQPDLNASDIEKMKQSVEKPEHVKIAITEKGPNYADLGLDLNRNMRNQTVDKDGQELDREINGRLKKTSKYFPALMTIFAKSLWQRMANQTYERNAKTSIAKIISMQKKIAKITDTILVNSANITIDLPNEDGFFRDSIIKNMNAILINKETIEKDFLFLKNNLMQYKSCTNQIEHGILLTSDIANGKPMQKNKLYVCIKNGNIEYKVLGKDEKVQSGIITPDELGKNVVMPTNNELKQFNNIQRTIFSITFKRGDTVETKQTLEASITSTTEDLLNKISSVEQEINNFTSLLNKINERSDYANALQANLTKNNITSMKSMYNMNNLALQDIKKLANETLYNINLVCPCQELKDIKLKHKALHTKHKRINVIKTNSTTNKKTKTKTQDKQPQKFTANRDNPTKR